MALKLTNNASSTLAGSISSSATTIVIQSADEAKFPLLSAGDWFPITVVDGAGNMEIMKCTARSGVTLTVARAQEATTARAFSAGSRADVRLTAGVFAGKGSGLAADTLAGKTIFEILPIPTTSASADFNTLTNPGWLPLLYAVAGANGPPSVSNYVVVQNLVYADAQITQIAYDFAGDVKGIYMRGRYTGTWSPWIRLARADEIVSNNGSTWAPGALDTRTANVENKVFSLGSFQTQAQAPDWLSFNTSQARFWFAKPVYVAGEIFAGTAYDKKVWHAGNMGTGSGLDAGLLEGKAGAYYLNAANMSGTFTGAVNGNGPITGGVITGNALATANWGVRGNAANGTVYGILGYQDRYSFTGQGEIANGGPINGTDFGGKDFTGDQFISKLGSFTSSASQASVMLGNRTAGPIYLRPLYSSAANQVIIDTAGNLTTTGYVYAGKLPALGEIGCYALIKANNTFTAGVLYVADSTWMYSNTASTGTAPVAVATTWRAMGMTTAAGQTTLFERIA